ncbi:hypothetical protein FJQ98_16490 [Lysinibacillus agricola]|uniref:Uncharacterized protein n=1 Tax=Lysinibacillus agricola TaxID=2590012 RepID=A0ABX7AMA7_9BACI|nr:MULTISPECIES: hypothetical protein [Lysinibacillus]KOS61472.1 hypothetical protein AN161_17935 [Lysinibacillus sp. FJAT-14222]QQP10844.1 hypothetical protein FJQ98_16490 [Lysinibacillus agricola]
MYERVKGVFNPKNLDTLKEEFKSEIGKTLIFRYAWLMDDDDPFPNEWALICESEKSTLHRIWIPKFDLDNIEILED